MSVAAKSSARNQLSIDVFIWIWVATAALFVVCAILTPGIVSYQSLLSMLPFAAVLAIVAVGQTVVIQQRGLDLSAAGMMTMGGVLTTWVAADLHTLSGALLITVIVSGAFGILNGSLVARLNITPIVATLATNAIFYGFVRSMAGTTVIIAPDSLTAFSHARFLGVPYTMILAIVFIAVTAVVTKKTKIGRNFVAVGAAARAAEAAGISVLRYQIGTYAFASICFAVAGIVFAGIIGSASNLAGNDYLLPGIAAVVVGGTSFVGGRGSVVASGVAAIFLVQLGQMVLALGASTAVQLLVQALAIVVATAIRHLPDILKAIALIRTPPGARRSS